MGTSKNKDATENVREPKADLPDFPAPVGKTKRATTSSKLAPGFDAEEVSPLTEQSASKAKSKASIDEAKVADTRSLINEAVNAVSAMDLEETNRIGAHVVENYFGGDYTEAITQNGHKNKSLRRICRSITCDDCVVKRSWLTEAVHLAAQQRELPADLVLGLGKGHMQALLMLKDSKDKVLWAEAIRKEPVGANELKRQIRDHLRAQALDDGDGSEGTKHDISLIFKVLETLSKKLSPLVSEGTEGGNFDFEALEPAQAAEMLSKIEDLQSDLGTLRAKIEAEAAE